MNNTQINILIFLLSSVGLIVLPHIANIPILIFIFFYAMLVWRVIAIWRPQYLPKKNFLIILTFFALALLFSQHRAILGRDAGTNLFIVALGLKLLETKSERDYYLVIYLSFIVAASLFLYQQSLMMAAYILAVCCILFATLVAINSIEIKTSVALKTAAKIVFQAIPLAIVIFILFPRVEAPRWMLFKEKPKAKMGLSDSIEPGSISELSLSEDLVFRVKFTGNLPPPRERYWRGPVLSYTDGKRWSMIYRRYLPLSSKPSFQGQAYSYTLLMEAQEKNWVFALELPAKFNDPLEQNGHYQLTTSDNPNKRAEYQITSYPSYNTGALSDQEYIDSTRLPHDISPRIKELVKQLHGFDNNPELFIQQLLNHFKTEKFYYTLTPPVMEDNPIETFLFKNRYGFCSHYATAFVYLMRVAGIPSRVITGYQGGNFNEVGHFLEVRQANAHAWTEVWIANKGWVRVDPTAA
ncbi:partial Protein-glutamine gamma-glutamyltransferase, partial [uncultured bacterium]